MLNSQFDVVIVGSGPAGVNAAYPLIHAGLKVAIVDGGLDTQKKDEKLDDFSDINLKETSNAYGLFKNNSYIFNRTYQLLRIKSKIEIIQTLAKGGFSQFWHGISDIFTSSELEATGLPSEEMQKEYKEISKRIRLQTDLPLDIHNRLILKAAEKKVNFGSLVYTLPSAANYIKTYSVDAFKKYKNFTYVPGYVVLSVKEKPKFVEAEARSVDNSSKSTFGSKYLIFAAGSINTTRILLRSFKLFNYQTTFLTKAHFVIACLHLRTIFKKKSFKEMKLGQVAISSNQTEGGISKFFVQLFRFSPSAVNKAIKYIPLPKAVSLYLMKSTAPLLVFADVRFPAFESKGKYAKLKKGSREDILEIVFQETQQELADHQKELVKIKKQLISLGLIPLKMGSDYITTHYAGGVPCNKKDTKLSSDIEGRLNKTKRIYIADSATWRALPGKSPTLTIMANASRIGKNVLKKYHQNYKNNL